MPASTESVLASFNVVTDWQVMQAHDADRIVEFWLREGALPSEGLARSRLPEVVLHALDDQGEIAGIATAYGAVLNLVGQPMYHFRCFVGKAWRASGLLRVMLRSATNTLEAHAAGHDFPCVGIALELENPRFRKALADIPVWHAKGVRFAYVGQSARGLDVRVHYFRGAKLKRFGPVI